MRDDILAGLFVLAVFLVGSVIGMIEGSRCEIKNLHKEAVEHGAGHWAVDKDGQTHFEWNK